MAGRARRYVERMPAAIAGSGGHQATFAVAVALLHGFALTENEAWGILCDYNLRCDPPWSERELEHKLESACNLTRHPKPRGYLWSKEAIGGASKMETPPKCLGLITIPKCYEVSSQTFPSSN
jgi:hypothetical protein